LGSEGVPELVGGCDDGGVVGGVVGGVLPEGAVTSMVTAASADLAQEYGG